MAATSVANSCLPPTSSFNPKSSHKIWRMPITNRLEKGVATEYPVSTPKSWTHLPHLTPLCATLRSPRGFGPPKKTKKSKKGNKGNDNDNDEEDETEEEEDREAGVIPEIVTNRMINRMGFTVGVPLFTGLLFFPFFYYLKVGLKIDVPTWVPFIVSFLFFGTALLGVSYGIVSSSWDPLRAGSFGVGMRLRRIGLSFGSLFGVALRGSSILFETCL